MPPSILVTLYNCQPGLSETIKSILKTKANLSGALLCIWNNGPESIGIPHEIIQELSMKGVRAKFIDTPQNAPLSWIYNAFIDAFGSENNVILDHDSTLSEDYLLYISSQRTAFVGVPIIVSKGLPQSPSIKGSFSSGPYKKKDCVVSIGSGLVISRQAVESVRAVYKDIFDESFALYGVDTSFFIRLHRLGLSASLHSVPGFEHSLSRLEAESVVIKAFRRTERSYDFGLMLRHYTSLDLLKTFAGQIMLRLINKNRINIKDMFLVLLSGRHKRCSPLRRKEFLEVFGRQNHRE